jgi:hypothetical protein
MAVPDQTAVPSSAAPRPPKPRAYVVPVVRPLPAPREARGARGW